MNNLKFYGLLCVICIIIVSCEKDKSSDNNLYSGNNDKITVVGEGDLVEQEITVSDFQKINNTGMASISVVKADTQKVTLKAQTNILDLITYEVKNDELLTGLDQNYNVQTTKGIFITIETPEVINKILLTGEGNVNLDTEKQAKLDLIINGIGNFNSLDTEIAECSIIIQGMGNCMVYVTEELNVTIEGMGNVKYKGNPVVNRILLGMGSVSKIE